MERYFLISYIFRFNGILADGNLCLSFNGFPSSRWLKQVILANGGSDPVIQHIYEFKNKDDYESYIL